MRTRQEAVPTAKTIRQLHAALVFGMLLFASIGYFVLRPSFAPDTRDFPAWLLPAGIAASLGACAVSLTLRRRVRRRAADESPDLFWSTASGSAMTTWVALDVATVVGVLLYAFTGSASAIGAAVIAIVLLVILNPARLERR
jgi:hypothetical protein